MIQAMKKLLITILLVAVPIQAAALEETKRYLQKRYERASRNFEIKEEQITELAELAKKSKFVNDVAEVSLIAGTTALAFAASWLFVSASSSVSASNATLELGNMFFEPIFAAAAGITNGIPRIMAGTALGTSILASPLIYTEVMKPEGVMPVYNIKQVELNASNLEKNTVAALFETTYDKMHDHVSFAFADYQIKLSSRFYDLGATDAAFVISQVELAKAHRDLYAAEALQARKLITAIESRLERTYSSED